MSLLATTPSLARTLYIGDDDPNYVRACKRITATEIIDAAIGWHVAWGLRFERERGGEDGAVNPYPYKSVAHFKAVNKHCCRVLESIPRDHERDVQALGEDVGGYRRLFAVRMKFIQHTNDGPITIYRTPFINCLGKRPEWR